MVEMVEGISRPTYWDGAGGGEAQDGDGEPENQGDTKDGQRARPELAEVGAGSSTPKGSWQLEIPKLMGRWNG